jgi:hypothetical protein
MSCLLEGPMKPWPGETAEEVRNLDEPNLKGFEILQDSHVFDLRKWTPNASGKSDSSSLIYGFKRLKILKQPENTGNHLFRIHLLPFSPLAQIRFPSQQLKPKLRMSHVESSVPGEKKCHWEASVDFQRVPAGDSVDFIYEHQSPGEFVQHSEGSVSLAFEIHAETAELTRWFLMPEGKEYRSFRTIRYETGKPGKTEAVKIATEYLAEDYTILAFKLLSLKPGYTYEVTWLYK